MAYNPNFNPNCGACGGLNSRGYCSYTACRFPQVTNGTVITINPPIYVDDTPKPKTNADRIRAMSDEELARFMAHYDSVTEIGEQLAYERWLNWLRQEALDA